MAAVSPTLVERVPRHKSRLTNKVDRLLTGDQRSAPARRFRDLVIAITNDQGGADRCSESRLQLIRRFAAAAVLAEQLEAKLASDEEINLQAHALLCSSLVRLAQRIGIGRHSRNVTPTLHEYLEQA